MGGSRGGYGAGLKGRDGEEGKERICTKVGKLVDVG